MTGPDRTKDLVLRVANDQATHLILPDEKLKTETLVCILGMNTSLQILIVLELWVPVVKSPM